MHCWTQQWHWFPTNDVALCCKYSVSWLRSLCSEKRSQNSWNLQYLARSSYCTVSGAAFQELHKLFLCRRHRTCSQTSSLKIGVPVSAVNQQHTSFCLAHWELMWFGRLRPRGDVEDSYQCPCYFTYLPDSLLSTTSLSFHSWSFTPRQQHNMLGSWQANNRRFKKQWGQGFQVQGFSKMWYVHIEIQLFSVT